MWDSQVKDGYKRSQTGESKAGETLPRAAPVTWDGQKTSVVVEELLRNSSDKAYGANSETRTPCLHTLTSSTQLLMVLSVVQSSVGMGRSLLLAKMPSKMPLTPRVTL